VHSSDIIDIMHSVCSVSFSLILTEKTVLKTIPLIIHVFLHLDISNRLYVIQLNYVYLQNRRSIH